MKLEINAVYHGFKVLQADYIKDVNSEAYLMEHIKSGARLFYLGNNDDNKVFSISFRTPPADDSGIPHILEHSALCGSRKYHLKEPFVDLVKGSLNTFLNAMTYPDKTMYPVASRNDKDFRNLMDVYLDAVLYPLIYKNKYTLRQEGWHYNIESPEGELSYNGVVYNEMKGVYSSPDAYLENEAMKALFPNTCYRFESGGYPDAIPTLTQEKFLDFHKTYYSPENSFIYLYGDMDIEETLAYLDGEYLANFTKTGLVNSEIAEQAPFARTAEVTATYPVDADEDCTAKTYHELNIVTGKATNVVTSMAMRLLEGVLLETESSPLRRALMDAGLGQNISGSYTSSMLQPVFSIKASGSEPELKDKFVSVIYKTLQDITINGLDKDLLTAALNSLEFKLRESDFGAYPKGLLYGIGLMESWLYGGDPMEYLRYEKALQAMRAGVDNRFYESLIENYLLDNTHKVLVTLTPEPGKEAKEQDAAAKDMQALKESMTAEEIQTAIAECAELHRLQAEPDSEEARASIPMLQRTDIRREVEQIEREVEQVNNSKLVYVPAQTNSIVYSNFYFDISSMPASKLVYCFLLTDILGKFDTDKYSFEELTTKSIMYTGGIAFDVKAIANGFDTNTYHLYFSMKAKALLENLPQLFDILSSVAMGTKLDNLKRFKELVAELKTDWDNEFFNRGQTVAITRLYSYCSNSARANEQDEFSYYQFIKNLDANFDEVGESVLAELQNILHMFYQKDNFTLLYSCDEQDRATLRAACLTFTDSLNEAGASVSPEVLPLPELNEAITTAGKVQYVAAGGSFAKFGHKFTGAMRVLETMLRYEYLWTKIRIQGGAYGATARFEMSGVGVFASYRDPQLTKTLEAYKEMPAWLKTLELSKRELDKYVIGTISSLDTPLTNSMRLDTAAQIFLREIDDASRQKVRDEVLDVSLSDLQALGQVVEDMLSDELVCVVGGKQPIEANSEIFKKIVSA